MTKFSARQRQYIRNKTQEPSRDPSESGGELNIIPFLDIVVNLVMFLLIATASVLSYSQLEASLPDFGPGDSTDPGHHLNLQVTVVDEGVIVSGAGGKLAEGCANTQDGRVVTVPREQNLYDWNRLTECMNTLSRAYPENDRVILAANPAVEYEHLVDALDAINATEDPRGGPASLNVMVAASVN